MKDIKSDGKRKATGQSVGKMSFLTVQARNLKRKPTPPEQFFWEQLRSSRIDIKFLKQHTVHGYIIDFWAPKERLAVELDGMQHLSRRSKDAKRDEVLRSHGIIVLRFPAQIVFTDLNFVFDRIKEIVANK